jgi:hypothetical protein
LAAVHLKDDNMKREARPLVFLDMDDVLCLDDVHHSGQMLKILEQTIPDYPEIWQPPCANIA